jgi:hypothetical protein
VGAKRPQRVLVGAQLAEVQAVSVDVEHAPELAGVDQLLELDDAGVVLEQMADHQRSAGALRSRHHGLGVGGRLRHRLLNEAVLARRDHLDRQCGVRRYRRRERHGVDTVVCEHLVEVGGRAGVREQRRDTLAVGVERIADPGELCTRECREVASDVRSPVPQAGDGDAQGAIGRHRASLRRLLDWPAR